MVCATTGAARDERGRGRQICDMVLAEAKCALVVADYSHLHKNAPKPSIRITVPAPPTTHPLVERAQQRLVCDKRGPVGLRVPRRRVLTPHTRRRCCRERERERERERARARVCVCV